MKQEITASETCMIAFTNVTKTYRDHTILQEFNLRIEANETVGLIGSSGAGKSTILKLAAKMIQPDTGTIRVNSTRVGYIFQSPRLIPWKTILKNVIVGAKALGFNKREAIAKGRRILKQTGLLKYENYYPSQLSGGMAQRVSIARALFIDPVILLMDEPFSALDPGLKQSMHDYIARLLNERGITLLYVTHLPQDVFKICKTVYMLHTGGQLDFISDQRSQYDGEEAFMTFVNSLYTTEHQSSNARAAV